MKDYKIETKAVQGVYSPKNGEPRVVPLSLNTTYKYESAKEVADLFDLTAAGHMYSRISNPTVEAFEGKMALLDGGVGAVAVSSGQSASLLSILNIAKAGDHFISSSTIYGGTFNLFFHTMKKMGIEVTFVDQDASLEDLKKEIRPNTRCVFAETLSNPGTQVLDIEKFSALAKSADIPLIVDNTFCTPFLLKPIDFGADIVVYSATKYIDGHAVSVGGVVVDSGKFNWKNGKFPELVDPDPSYHGTSYTEWFKESAYIVKLRVQLIRDIGNLLPPMNAWLSNLGLETLHLRMERHSENALKLAKFLQGHKNVAWVRYPYLEEDKNFSLAKKYLPKGASGVLNFGVAGGFEAGEKFMNKLKLAAIVVHVADLRTSVLHPASMTHRQLDEEQQKIAGVLPDLIRVSVGLENIDDIIEDFAQALEN